jgi:C2 domain
LQPSKNEGSIQLSLDFTSVGGKEIEICAFFAKGLHLSNMKSDGSYSTLTSLIGYCYNLFLETLNTFVKASFYVKGKKEKSKKSPIVKDVDPWYNHTFNFSVPSEAQLMDSLVVVSVVHKSGMLSQEQLVGKVIFGPYYFLKSTQTDWGNAILKGQKITRWYDLHMIN